MKSSKLWEKAEGLRGILLSAYLLVILLPVMYDIKIKYPYLSAVCILFSAMTVFAAVLFAGPFLVRKLKTFNFSVKDERIAIRHWGGVFALILFCTLLIRYIGYYPGFFSNDSLAQLDQALSGSYNDWHPVIHTLFSFTLPLKMTNGWTGSIVLFQIVVFSIVVGYAGTVLLRYSNWFFALMSVMIIMLSPATGLTCMYPWKDVSMAAGALLCSAFAVKICFSKGKWLDSMPHMIVFAVSMVFTTLVRHNAILFTAPFLLGVILCIGCKRRYQITILIVMLLLLVKEPLYSLLNVGQPGNRQVEILGLPMTVIGNVVVEHPELLDEESREFVYKVASQEDWNNYYVMGSFNHIKWSEKADLSIIEDAGVFPVLKTMVRCAYRAPISAAKAVIMLTKPVYALDKDSSYYQIGLAVNEYEMPAYAGNPQIASLLSRYDNFIYGSFLRYFLCYIGIGNLIVIIGILSKANLASAVWWRKVLLSAPVLIYNFGTMLLLMGRDDRFFYVTFLVWPISVLILLGNGD